MDVLLRQTFLVGYRLNGSVVVMLVNLTVDGLLNLLVLVRLYRLSNNSWVDDLVNISRMASVRGEGLDGVLCGFHDGQCRKMSIEF